VNLKNLYSVKETQTVDADTVLMTITIAKNHKIFKGHFPDHPVLPGVALLHIVKDLSESHCGENLLLSTAQNIKYLSVVDPNVNDVLLVRLQFQQEQGRVNVKNSTTFVDGTEVMKGTITFSKK